MQTFDQGFNFFWFLKKNLVGLSLITLCLRPSPTPGRFNLLLIFCCGGEKLAACAPPFRNRVLREFFVRLAGTTRASTRDPDSFP